MLRADKENLHGGLNYTPITLFGDKLKIGVIGGGRGALIKVRNFYSKGSYIEVLALDFLSEFQKFDMERVNIIKGCYSSDFIIDKHLIIIAVDDDDVIEKIKCDCEKLHKIYVNSSRFKDGMGVIPVSRESEFITVAVNTKVGNPRGAVMVAESIKSSLKSFDQYINLTGKIRNCIYINKDVKEDLLKFINCSDCKFFFDKDNIINVLRLFYNEDIVDKIISLRKEENHDGINIGN